MLDSEARRSPLYEGSGTTGPFSFGFTIYDSSQVTVRQTDADGVEKTLAASEYTVTLGASGSGGTVTLASALPVGARLVIKSNIPYDQPLGLERMGEFNPDDLNRAWDRNCALIQQVLDLVERAVKVPDFSDETAEEFTDSLFAARDEAVDSAAAAAESEANAAASAAAAAKSAEEAAKSAEEAAEAVAKVEEIADEKIEEIEQKGDEVLAAITAEGEAQIEAVKEAGRKEVESFEAAADEIVAEAKADIVAEGDAQVKRVTEAGSEAVDAVEQAGAAQTAEAKKYAEAAAQSEKNAAQSEENAAASATAAKACAADAAASAAASQASAEASAASASTSESAADRAEAAAAAAEENANLSRLQIIEQLVAFYNAYYGTSLDYRDYLDTTTDDLLSAFYALGIGYNKVNEV